MESSRSYLRVDQEWPCDSHLSILYPSGELLAHIPMVYLEASHTNDWQLVYDIVQALIVEPISIFTDKGLIDQLEAKPEAGAYIVRASADYGTPLTPKQGPEGNRRHVPLNDEIASSLSNSSRSTTRQMGFRLDLVARDSRCVLTGMAHSSCIASHIVPFSRLDVYQRIYLPGLKPDNLFAPNMGLLLADHLSRAFDRFSWSIYIRKGAYYFHGPCVIELQKYHGTALKVADGREWPKNEMPNPIFCKWHWEQCMQAHIRGYAIWPRLDEISRTHPRSPQSTAIPSPLETFGTSSGDVNVQTARVTNRSRPNRDTKTRPRKKHRS